MKSKHIDRLVITMIDHHITIRIAIVEDNIDLACLRKQFFDRKGMYVSFVAYDGAEAIKKFSECSKKPEIALMDYRLPTKNGIETMKEILRICKGTGIIFLSADSDIEKESLQAEAVLFMKKPACLNDLYQAIYTASDDIWTLDRAVKSP